MFHAMDVLAVNSIQSQLLLQFFSCLSCCSPLQYLVFGLLLVFVLINRSSLRNTEKSRALSIVALGCLIVNIIVFRSMLAVRHFNYISTENFSVSSSHTTQTADAAVGKSAAGLTYFNNEASLSLSPTPTTAANNNEEQQQQGDMTPLVDVSSKLRQSASTSPSPTITVSSSASSSAAFSRVERGVASGPSVARPLTVLGTTAKIRSQKQQQQQQQQQLEQLQERIQVTEAELRALAKKFDDVSMLRHFSTVASTDDDDKNNIIGDSDVDKDGRVVVNSATYSAALANTPAVHDASSANAGASAGAGAGSHSSRYDMIAERAKLHSALFGDFAECTDAYLTSTPTPSGSSNGSGGGGGGFTNPLDSLLMFTWSTLTTCILSSAVCVSYLITVMDDAPVVSFAVSLFERARADSRGKQVPCRVLVEDKHEG